MTGLIKKYFLLIAIIITSIIVLFPVINCGFTNWDDNLYITQNPDILSITNINLFFSKFYLGNYHPITMLSYSLDYLFFKLNPKWFHLMNLIYHLINLVLVFIFIKKLNFNKNIAFFIALFFSIHPMHVESVAWLSERKDLLFVMFGLLSLIFYINFSQTRKKINYIISILFFLMSLLSKSQAIVIPFIMILIDIFFFKFHRKNILEKIPHFIFSIGFSIITIIAQSESNTIGNNYEIIQSLIYPSIALSNYISGLILPINLSAFHPKIFDFKITDYFSVLSIIVLGFVIIISIKSKNLKIAFGLIFFIISLLPVLQIVPFGDALFADRYTYFSSIGFFIVLLEIGNKLYNGFKKYKTYIFAFLFVYIFIMSYISRAYIPIWKNSFTLWTDVLEKYPKSYLANTNIASAYYEIGDYNNAIKFYNIAIENNKNHYKIYHDRGLTYSKLKKFDLAISDYTSSINLKNDYSSSYSNRGLAYQYINDSINSLKDYNKAIDLNPENSFAYSNRGLYYNQYKNYYQAIEDFKKSISISPNNEINFYNLANAYAYTNDYENAILYYSKAIEINNKYPEAYYNRGIIKIKTGNEQSGNIDINIAKGLNKKKSIY